MGMINQPAGTPNREVLEAQVASLMAAVDKGMAEALSPYGLNALEFKLLKFCMENEECTATQLSEVLPTDPARISRLVNGLVEMGLLSRRRLTSDRRVVMLSLTDAGIERTQGSDRSIQAFFEVLAEGISEDDLATFVATVLRMTANCDALGPAGQP